jgi:tetratricopeptide (TPR) repeat protein
VAGRLDPKRYGVKRVFDLQARAWGELANALRVSDDLEEAERAFGIAFDLLLQGTDDLDVKARLYDLNASFLGTRRRFSLAFAALDLVHASYLELGDRHLAGRALITKAIYTHYSGDSEVALRINAEGLSLVDKGRDPDLVFQAIHNRLWFLIACNRFREAKRVLFLHQSELQNCGGEISRLKLRWLQGQIWFGLEEFESACIAFLEVIQGFESAGLGFAAALASLDLALVFFHQGKYSETEDLVAEAAEVFFAVGVHREALSSIMILKDSFEKRQGTIALLESVIEFLRRSQIDPEARFTPRF